MGHQTLRKAQGPDAEERILASQDRVFSDSANVTSQNPVNPDDVASFVRPHQAKQQALVRVIDSCIVLAGLWGTTALLDIYWPGRYYWSDLYLSYGVTGLLVFQFFAEYNEVYHSWRGHRLSNQLFRLFGSWSFTVLTLIVFSFVWKMSGDTSRLIVGIWFVGTLTALSLFHTGYHFLVRVARVPETRLLNVGIVGLNHLGKRLQSAFQDTPSLGYRFVGYYDDRADQGDRRLTCLEGEFLGGLEKLCQDAQEGRLDVVYVVLPMKAERRVQDLLAQLGDTAATVFFVPNVFVFNAVNSRCVMLQGIPCFSVYGSPFDQDPLDGLLKRIEDLVLSSIILTLVLPLMLMIAVGVKLSSPGPVIFKQRRYGVDGSSIDVWKFRTMTVCENGPVVRQVTRDDPRIKPFGAFLRRYSLDELPQFFNVLQGRMSIVGPRPHAVAHNEFYRKEIFQYMIRHKVKPGVTGLAQINGCRGETDTMDKMERRVSYDLEYIEHWSLLLDLKIIVLTVFRVFRDSSAY